MEYLGQDGPSQGGGLEGLSRVAQVVGTEVWDCSSVI